MSGTKTLKNIFYVPKINHNLVCVGQLIEFGYSIFFNDGVCDIKNKNGVLLLFAKMMNKSFNVDWREVCLSANTYENTESVLWHKRLGHFNYATLKRMVDLLMTHGLPDIQEQKSICEACKLGKQTRVVFPDNAYRALSKLQLVHTDVYGSVHNESLNGSNFLFLFVDDYSRYCWVYFLKSKSNVFVVFVKFKAAVELETRNKLKILRFDNGGEYTSRQFEAYLAKEGIKNQLTIPYTPQQNEVSERRNRTLMEMARCLLYEKKMPLKFWAEAVNATSYLLNRMTTRVLGDKTPYEIWYALKPNVHHLKVFGRKE